MQTLGIQALSIQTRCMQEAARATMTCAECGRTLKRSLQGS